MRRSAGRTLSSGRSVPETRETACLVPPDTPRKMPPAAIPDHPPEESSRTATTQPSIPERIPTRVRWDILRRTVMDFTTWLGMYLSGVGIGMGRHMVSQLLLIQI